VNAHDTGRLLDFYGDEAVSVSPVFAGIAGGAAIAKSWDPVFSLFPDWTVNVSDVLVDGDRIAFLGTAAATDRNGWFGQPPTGERIVSHTIIYSLCDGATLFHLLGSDPLLDACLKDVQRQRACSQNLVVKFTDIKVLA